MQIPPIPPSGGNFPVDNSNTLQTQLWQYISELRAMIKDPSKYTPSDELKLLQKFEAFLTKYKSQIEEQCYKHGFRPNSKNWTTDYMTFLDHSITGIKSAISELEKDPSSPLPSSMVDYINEETTQLHWLLSSVHDKK
jgi:hypothetical protein